LPLVSQETLSGPRRSPRPPPAPARSAPGQRELLSLLYGAQSPVAVCSWRWTAPRWRGCRSRRGWRCWGWAAPGCSAGECGGGGPASGSRRGRARRPRAGGGRPRGVVHRVLRQRKGEVMSTKARRAAAAAAVALLVAGAAGRAEAGLIVSNLSQTQNFEESQI